MLAAQRDDGHARSGSGKEYWTLLNSLGFMHDKIRISSNVLYLNLKLKQTKKKKEKSNQE